MKIALFSGVHIGLTKYEQVHDLFADIGAHQPDLIIAAGDYVGGIQGYRTVRSTFTLLRKHFPSTPVVATVGNHERYFLRSHRQHPTLSDWNLNYKKICEIFADLDIHFLDEDGLYRDGLFVFVGACGWYSHPNPPTNCSRYFPPQVCHGDLLTEANDTINKQLKHLDQFYTPEHEVMFVSHFPVIDPDPRFGWNAQIGTVMFREYGCRHFFEGHTHRRKSGPIRYSCGSDYFNPKFLIVEV